MTFTTKDLKLTAYLTACGYEITSLAKLNYKDLDSGKDQPPAYQITLNDYNDDGKAIKEAMATYSMPSADNVLTAGQLCYIIGANLDALRDCKGGKLYRKVCKHYQALSAAPAKDYKVFVNSCPYTGNFDTAIFYAFGEVLPNLDDPELAKVDNNTPLAIAKAYLQNLQFLTICPKKEKLVITKDGRTLIINKDASAEDRKFGLKMLNN